MAQGPENVLVVVNAESQDSLAVANKYIGLRDIPACNVVYLTGVSNFRGHKHGEESTLSWKFKKEILQPILKAIKDRGLERQIDCIAYSAGFPTRVNFNSPELKRYLEQTGQKYSYSLHNPWASITSFTYFHRNATSKQPDFLKLDANRFANPLRMKVLANPFTAGDARKFDSAMKDVSDRKFLQATEKFTALAKDHREQVSVIYALARCFAHVGENRKSLAMLEHAKRLGFSYRSLLIKDEAFLALHSEPRFIKLVQAMEDLPNGLHPTRSFSSQKYWAKNGWANGNVDQGERYMLSSVLAVTSENRSPLQASLNRLEASVAADGTFPNGNVYFADHKDVRSKCRRGQFQFAAAELKSLSRSVSIDSDIYPIGDDRIIGATLGSPVLNWAKSGSMFLPGAICDNLTSAGGVWIQSSQTPLSEFLDAGAAGASGTVCEPYTFPAKFPTARWHAHYARGATLVESFFQSVAGPFQLLLVGDPLCCPFGKFPEFEIVGLDDGAKTKNDFELQVQTKTDSPKIVDCRVFLDGVFVSEFDPTESIPVQVDAMSDGYHEIRVVAVSEGPVANKRSKTLAFFVDHNECQISFAIEKTRFQRSDIMTGRAAFSRGNRVEIRHNTRTLTTVSGGGTFRIPCARIGTGKVKLRAVAIQTDGTVLHSWPVEIEIQH